MKVSAIVIPEHTTTRKESLPMTTESAAAAPSDVEDLKLGEHPVEPESNDAPYDYEADPENAPTAPEGIFDPILAAMGLKGARVVGVGLASTGRRQPQLDVRAAAENVLGAAGLPQPDESELAEVEEILEHLVKEARDTVFTMKEPVEGIVDDELLKMLNDSGMLARIPSQCSRHDSCPDPIWLNAPARDVVELVQEYINRSGAVAAVGELEAPATTTVNISGPVTLNFA